MSWRTRCIHHLDPVLSALPPDADRATIRRAVREAYPFGPRKGWPYCVWISEVRHQLRARFPALFGYGIPRKRRRAETGVIIDPTEPTLFD